MVIQIGGPRYNPPTPQYAPQPPAPPPPQPQKGTVGADVQGLASPGDYAALKEAIPSAQFEFIESSNPREIVAWRLTIPTLDGGFFQRGSLDEHHASVSITTADNRSRGKLTHPFKSTAATTPDPTNQSPTWMTWADDIFGKLAIGVASAGGGGSVNLFSEDASTAVISSHTYAAQIISLTKVILNGTTYLAVGKGGANAVQLLSDLASTPTSAGSMHSDTNGCVGIQQMRWLPDMPILGKSGTILWKLSGNPGSLGTQPTTVLSNLVAGGGPVGQLGVGGRPIRVYWLWAESSAVVAYSNTVNLRVVSTNGFGTDVQETPFDLNTVRGARVLRDGIFAHNGTRAQFYNGGAPRDMRWIFDRKLDVTRDFLMVAPYIYGNDLYCEVNEIEVASSGFITKRWIEMYDWDLNKWQNASKPVTLTGQGQKTLNAFSLPASQETGHLHCYADGSWYRQFQRRAGEEAYNYRGYKDYEATVDTYSAGLIFPEPIAYVPKVVTGIYMGGEVSGGGTTLPTPGAVEVEVKEYGNADGTGIRHAWDADIAAAGRYAKFPTNQSRLLFPQIRITQTQGASTTATTQALPIVVEGLAFLPNRTKRRWLPW